MSNYLSNLTARSFNQAEVLQPRLASRFEPPIGYSPAVQMNLEQRAIAAPNLIDPTLETLAADVEPQQATEVRSINTSAHFFNSPKLETKENSFKPDLGTLGKTDPESKIIQQSFIDLGFDGNAERDNNRNLKSKFFRSNINLESRSQQESKPLLDQTQAVISPQRKTELNRSPLTPVEPAEQPSLATPSLPAMPSAKLDSIDPAVDLAPDRLQSLPKQQPVTQQQPITQQQLASTTNQSLQQSTNSQTTLVPIATEHRLDSQKSISSSLTESTPNVIRDSVHNIIQSSIPKNSQSEQIPDGRLTVEPRLSPHIVKPVVAQPQIRSTSLTATLTEPVSEPTPTVQVTIGRIEIRAAVAASPSPKPRSSPTVMGLDDYLRQRAKGASQ